MDSNHRMRAPKARALPLGDAPKLEPILANESTEFNLQGVDQEGVPGVRLKLV